MTILDATRTDTQTAVLQGRVVNVKGRTSVSGALVRTIVVRGRVLNAHTDAAS